MNTNPFEAVGLFATPESMEALQSNADRYSDSERAAFTMGMMLTWNFISSEIDRILAEESEDQS